MIIKNKTFFTCLSLSFFLVSLFSCSRQISKEEAAKFINENYHTPLKKKILNAHAKWDFKATENDALLSIHAIAIISQLTNEVDLQGDKYLEHKIGEEIENMHEFKEESLVFLYRYFVNGKQLTIEKTVEDKTIKFSPNCTTVYTETYNNEGFLIKSFIDMKDVEISGKKHHLYMDYQVTEIG